MRRGKLGVAALALCLLVAGDAAATTPTGDPGQVVFNRDSGVGTQGDLYLMDAAGGTQTPLTASGSATDYFPAFSADGRRIFFTRIDLTNDLYVVNRDGSGLAPLVSTGPPIHEFEPASSPDGKQVAFERFSAGDSDILVINSDGTGEVNLTNTPNIREGSPTYSPDGRLIAFSYDNGADPSTLWVMNADGSSPRPVTIPGPGPYDTNPSFSRDGTKIAFVSGSGGFNDVFVVNLDGSGRQNISMSPGVDEYSPSFTADASRVGFGACGMQCDILTVPAAGGPSINVSNTPLPVAENFPDFEAVQRCGKRRATIVGDDGPDEIKGTKRKDVIVANAGKNKVKARGGNDVICAGKKGRISCGKGNDKVVGKFKKAKGCERGKGL